MTLVPWLLVAAWMARFLCEAHQPIILVHNEDLGGFNVDVQQFAQLFSRHILINRVDNAFTHLSKRMAQGFRDAFQVKSVGQVDTSDDNDGIDIQILLDQLNDAVGGE